MIFLAAWIVSVCVVLYVGVVLLAGAFYLIGKMIVSVSDLCERPPQEPLPAQEMSKMQQDLAKWEASMRGRIPPTEQLP